MNPMVHTERRLAIVYDADRLASPGSHLFDPVHWEQAGAVTGRAAGRGSTLMLETPFGPAVLRPYLRGGWPARVSRNRYLFTGFTRSRGFREFHLLRQLTAMGLPVPAPLGAICSRGLLTCTAAILMERIQGVAPLQSLLGREPAESPVWGLAGGCIREFHRAGVHHADLNAGNVLVDVNSHRVFLVDFDRCSYRPGRTVAGEANLPRLKRSLVKNWPDGFRDTLEACWGALLEGYRG
jgi:3-deoxy-D-manno-octulosonic acid kinase